VILAALGLGMMVAGIVLVVIQSARNWSWPSAAAKRDAESPEKPGISYSGVILIGIGAVLVMLATSGWL
jgi:hypothetical protein